MVSLAFALAASGNVPALILSLYWRGCTRRGVAVGGLIGVAAAFVLALLSPAVWTLTFKLGDAPFRYSSPAIVSVPLGFLAIWIVSALDRSPAAEAARALSRSAAEVENGDRRVRSGRPLAG